MKRRLLLGAMAGLLASVLSWVANRYYWIDGPAEHHVSIADPVTLAALCLALYFIARDDLLRQGGEERLPVWKLETPVVLSAGLVFGGGVVLVGLQGLSAMTVHMGVFGFVAAFVITALCGACADALATRLTPKESGS